MRKLFFPIVSVLLLLSSLNAWSAATPFHDRNTWASSVARDVTTITFEGMVAASSRAFYPSPPGLLLQGVTLYGGAVPGLMTTAVDLDPAYYDYGSGVSLESESHSITVILPSGTRAFGVDLMTPFSSGVPVTITLNTGESFSTLSLARPSRSFLGVISNTQISSLTISTPGFLLIDNVSLPASAARPAPFRLSSIDFPGGTLTTARSINDRSDIVGAYRVTPPRHTLLIRSGQFLPLGPGTFLQTNYSEAFKSNDRGDVIGQYIGDDSIIHGFSLTKGTLTTLDFPGASDTYPFGINNSGTVVGYWDILDANGNALAYHGFTWNDGTFKEVNFPGSADSVITGINARGDLVGAWDSDITSPIGHAFFCSRGQCSSFDVPVPGATISQPNDINAQGQMVGTWIDADGGEHGFFMNGASFTTLDYPGASFTTAWGINSAGELVGDYSIEGGPSHGFLAQPVNKAK
jgi:hypothetical protein